MSYLRIDDAFPEHPKVHPLDDRAFRLHMHALCYCARNLTDGNISPKGLRQLLGSCDAKPRHVKQLVEHGLWHEADAYRIHDYLEKNPTGAEVRELREARKEAGRVGGTRSGQARRKASATANASNGVGKQNGKHAGSTPNPSHPQKTNSEGFALDVARTPPLQRLVAAAGGGTEAAQKVMRALGFPPPSDDELEHIIGCATGKNVRDPLAVALAELSKIARAKTA